MDRYLYRGVNKKLYQESAGRLIPKNPGQPFKRLAYYDGDFYHGIGITYGESKTNAVIMHQIDSSRYSGSGISTTPIFENAKRYATHDGVYASGYVYK